MLKTTNILLYVCLGLLLASCITAIDEALPYAQLPEITVATQFNLVASPAQPTAYLPFDPILAGKQVQVIGADKNAAWLLVLYDNRLGWMPSFFSRTNVGALKPAIVIEPLGDKCARYLDTTLAPDEAWVSPISGSAFVIGSIYRPQAGRLFSDATLALEMSDGGTAIASDYVHVPLTASSAIVLFAYSMDHLQKGSEISFKLANPANERLSFQAAFFSNECASDPNILSIGKTKFTTTAQTANATDVGILPTQTPSTRTQTPTPIPVVIAVEQGAPKLSAASKKFGFGFTICTSSTECDIHLWDFEQNTSRPLTEEPGVDYFGSWSPDGAQFVFVSNRSGTWQLYIYDMATHRPIQQITDSANVKLSPSWSPDGEQIVYSESIEDNGQIWKVNLETMERQQLTNTGTKWSPQWSFQGDKIVFNAAHEDTNSEGKIDYEGTHHIYEMGSDGENVRQIMKDPNYYDWFPYWMPDGVHVVFSRHAKGKTMNDIGPGEIYMVNTVTGELRALTFTSADEESAVPSLTGDQFLIRRVEEDINKLYLADWDGQNLGEPVFITDGLYAAWRAQPEAE